MKTKKRILAFFLAFVMLLSVVPSNSLAIVANAEEGVGDDAASDGGMVVPEVSGEAVTEMAEEAISPEEIVETADAATASGDGNESSEDEDDTEPGGEKTPRKSCRYLSGRIRMIPQILIMV